MDIKRRLCDLNVQYFMLYPAKLKIIANGNSHFFDNPKAAMHWLDRDHHNNTGTYTEDYTHFKGAFYGPETISRDSSCYLLFLSPGFAGMHRLLASQLLLSPHRMVLQGQVPLSVWGCFLFSSGPCWPQNMLTYPL